MRKFLIHNFLFLLVAVGAVTGVNAFGKEIAIGPTVGSVLLPTVPKKPPLGDMEDAQDITSTETDKEVEDDDDSSKNQRPGRIQLTTKVNLIFVFQHALFKEHHHEVVSPPPQG
ncbi:MAG: hypothetical protein O2887_06680 [Bacteroidetes bacterium]|nr:hypothetical protein [Bacteroidota bacterium]MDA1120167.1 hypothetical protein [Bacteroidota bacterium]